MRRGSKDKICYAKDARETRKHINSQELSLAYHFFYNYLLLSLEYKFLEEKIKEKIILGLENNSGIMKTEK